MNVLQVVQEFCGKKTLPVPAAVVGSTDVGVVQIRYILAEVVRDLSEYSWQEQRVEKTLVSIPAENQGLLENVIGPDFVSIVSDTFWNLAEDQPISGPVAESTWAAMKAENLTGPINYWRVIGRSLFIFPVLAAGVSLSLTYRSSYPILSSGGTTKAAVTSDDDTFLLPETLVLKALDYKWKYQKGEPWEKDYAEYSALLPKKLGDKGMPTLHLDGGETRITPGIWVPAGSWPVI
jgi:hypothetical protein